MLGLGEAGLSAVQEEPGGGGGGGGFSGVQRGDADANLLAAARRRRLGSAAATCAPFSTQRSTAGSAPSRPTSSGLDPVITHVTPRKPRARSAAAISVPKTPGPMFWSRRATSASNLAPSAVGRSCRSSLPIATSTKALRSSAVSPIDPDRVMSAWRTCSISPSSTARHIGSSSMPTTIGRRTTPESSESQNSPTSTAAPGPAAPEEGGGGGVVGRAATPSATRAAATAPGGSGVAGRRAWKFVATRPVAAADVVSQTAPPTAETAFATVSSPTPVESEAE